MALTSAQRAANAARVAAGHFAQSEPDVQRMPEFARTMESLHRARAELLACVASLREFGGQP